eukprot:gene4472-4726_t
MDSTKYLDITGLQAKFDELVLAITASIETGASKDEAAKASEKLGVAREQLLTACNRLLDDLGVLRQLADQHSASSTTRAAQLPERRQHEAANGHRSADTDVVKMEVDQQQLPDPQQAATAIQQQLQIFMQQLQPEAVQHAAG